MIVDRDKVWGVANLPCGRVKVLHVISLALACSLGSTLDMEQTSALVDIPYELFMRIAAMIEAHDIYSLRQVAYKSAALRDAISNVLKP